MIYFVAGLRTGSTLLMNLLGQNPSHHVTPTNDLIELFVGVRNVWTTFAGFKSQGLMNVQPRVASAMASLLRGFYAGELSQGKTVFDKSRGWFAYIELLEEVLERQVRIIATVRDIRDVVASFEKLHRRSSMTKFHGVGEAYIECQTIDGRARQLLSKDAALGLYVARLLDVFDRGLEDRLIVVPYRELTEQPQQTLARIHMSLGLPPFVYDPRNVEQITHEDDSEHGMELHTVRRKVESEIVPPWIGVLPERTAEWLDKEYSDIQVLANRRYNHGLASFLADTVRSDRDDGVCQVADSQDQLRRGQVVGARGDLG